MNWMDRLLNGEDPLAPNSRRSAPSWDGFVALARSPDGRQRQAAVRALSASRHAPALPVLLERLNDWVDAVRRDAREAVDNFLVDELLDAWIAGLGGVAALTRGGRTDHAQTLQRIVAWLQAPHRLARLRAAPVTVPCAVERLLFRARLSACADAADRLQAWHEGLRSSDIALAGDAADALRIAAAALVDDASGRSQLISLAQSAFGSRFSRIRLAGWRIAYGLDPHRGLQLARTMCFDRNAHARALAIGALRDDPDVLATLVAQAIDVLGTGSTARERATALEALCSLDDLQGLAASKRSMQDPAPAVRVVALRRMLAGTSADERDALVHQALADPSAKVRRVAVAQVHRGANPPTATVLASLCRAWPAALASLLGVATHLPPWDRFTLLLDLAHDSAALALDARRVLDELARWSDDMRQCFLAPAPARVEPARQAWVACRDLLPRTLQSQVAFQLQAFGVLAR